MRYFEQGQPRAVPKSEQMPFFGHRTMAEVLAEERRDARKHLRQIEPEEPA